MTEAHTEKQRFVISSSVCLHQFGFLGQRPKGTEVPDECLMCEKLLECLSSKPKADVVTLETAPGRSAAESAKGSEERIKPAAKESLKKEDEKHGEADKPSEARLDNEFTVESLGMLYAQWSSTVLICRETLQRWGKKVKQVEIETDKGKRIKCVVYPIEGLESGVIQIPDKMQLSLGVKKGSILKVKPVVKS